MKFVMDRLPKLLAAGAGFALVASVAACGNAGGVDVGGPAYYRAPDHVAPGGQTYGPRSGGDCYTDNLNGRVCR